MDIRELKTFIAAAETGSFTRAGGRFRYSTAAASVNGTIYAIGDIPSRIEPEVIAVIIGCAVAACVVGALVPSYLAARLRPVETLHAMRT